MRSTLLNIALPLMLFGAVAAANAETPADAAAGAKANVEAGDKAGVEAGAKVDAKADAAADSTAGAMAGDAEAGKRVFIKCGVCHAVEKDVSKIGPSLHGVMGRKAGTLASYPNYSDQLKASGVVWDEKAIIEFVKNPRTFIKNTRMLFIGLKDDKEIANLLAYLNTVK